MEGKNDHELSTPLNKEDAPSNKTVWAVDAESQNAYKNQHEEEHGSDFGRVFMKCMGAIPTLTAYYLLRPFGIIRHNALAKILVIFASMYMIVVTSLYMFGGDFMPFLSGGGDSQLWGHGNNGDDRLHPAIPARPEEQNELKSDYDPHEGYDKYFNNPDDEQPFEWADFVDVTMARDAWKLVKGEGDFGKWDGKDPFKDMKFPPKAKSQEVLSLTGRHYIDQYMPKPRKVFFLGENGRTIKVLSDEEAAARNATSGEEGLEKRGNVNEAIRSKDSTYEGLLSKDLKDKIEIEIPWDHFIFDPIKTAEDCEKNHGDDPEYLEHAKMLRWAAEHVKDSGKHFNEIPIDPHYDWRFFNMLRKGKDHEAFMHHLIRAWSQFSDQENILSLIAHGSLIGWYWDGMAMPWDADNDVQMPIKELDRFARKFNQTLVVEDPKEGNGRYFIDIGPWYVQREKGNGKNVIDARFIDVRSGIYLDITGLAATTEKPDKKDPHCKSPHYYPQDKLSPARRTLYEGVHVYVPNQFEWVLESEYKGFKKPSFKDYFYHDKLRLWVKENECKQYNDKTKQFKGEELTLYGACDNADTWGEYNRTKLVTKEHEEEMTLYSSLHTIAGPDEDEGDIDASTLNDMHKKLATMMTDYHPPLRYDPL